LSIIFGTTEKDNAKFNQKESKQIEMQVASFYYFAPPEKVIRCSKYFATANFLHNRFWRLLRLIVLKRFLSYTKGYSKIIFSNTVD